MIEDETLSLFEDWLETTSYAHPTWPEGEARPTWTMLMEAMAYAFERGQQARVPNADALPPRLRFEVLKRDGFTCCYCGADSGDAKLHVDHITPRCDGGTNDPDNLATACASCNLGKGPVPLGDRRLDA